MFRKAICSVYASYFMLDLRIPKARDMKQKELAALGVLLSTEIDVLEAALVAKAVLEAGGARASEATARRALKRSRKIIALGVEALRQQERTVTFEKAVEAALLQVEAIHNLKESGQLNQLPEKLKEAAQLRLDHPADTLLQLAQRCDPPITKSALNHRLRKLVELGKK